MDMMNEVKIMYGNDEYEIRKKKLERKQMNAYVSGYLLDYLVLCHTHLAQQTHTVN